MSGLPDEEAALCCKPYISQMFRLPDEEETAGVEEAAGEATTIWFAELAAASGETPTI